jgi:hypothetical protein
MRGIDVEVSTTDDKKVVVTIRSAVGNENRSGITVDQASKILSDAKGWGSSVVVSLQVKGVELNRYLPLITAIEENPWLGLSSINGNRYMEAPVAKEPPADPYSEEAHPREPSDPLSEEALLISAKTDARARHFLADLWQRGLLTATIRERIVTQHLHFELREEFPHDPKRFPTLRELKIIAETDFPFPEKAWVQFSSDIAVGDRELRLEPDNFGNSRSLHGANGRYFGSLGGSYEGSPPAKGVIQFREIDRDGKVPESAWVIRRETNSIRLENRTKVEQAGAGQPATRPESESKSEGGDKPQPEAEGRSR